MSSSLVDGNDPLTGHIISTTIGGKNGEPKRVGIELLYGVSIAAILRFMKI